jgi:hypothetical protein
MDQLSFSQLATIVVACVVNTGLLFAALALIFSDRRERPLAALRGEVIQARRAVGPTARWGVNTMESRRAQTHADEL